VRSVCCAFLSLYICLRHDGSSRIFEEESLAGLDVCVCVHINQFTQQKQPASTKSPSFYSSEKASATRFLMKCMGKPVAFPSPLSFFFLSLRPVSLNPHATCHLTLRRFHNTSPLPSHTPNTVHRRHSSPRILPLDAAGTRVSRHIQHAQ